MTRWTHQWWRVVSTLTIYCPPRQSRLLQVLNSVGVYVPWIVCDRFTLTFLAASKNISSYRRQNWTEWCLDLQSNVPNSDWAIYCTMTGCDTPGFSSTCNTIPLPRPRRTFQTPLRALRSLQYFLKLAVNWTQWSIGQLRSAEGIHTAYIFLSYIPNFIGGIEIGLAIRLSVSVCSSSKTESLKTFKVGLNISCGRL